MPALQNLTVYYDGLCHLCSREIEHYKKLPGGQAILFVDITDPSFNAEKENLNPVAVHKVMHVKTSSGEIKTAVDAFILIWEQIPRYHVAAWLAKRWFVKPILLVGYHIFARIRPYLPRRKKDCESSPYCETKKD